MSRRDHAQQILGRLEACLSDLDQLDLKISAVRVDAAVQALRLEAMLTRRTEEMPPGLA